jgi:hypothetical protein
MRHNDCGIFIQSGFVAQKGFDSMKTKSEFPSKFIFLVSIISSLLLGQITAGCQAAQPKSGKQSAEGKGPAVASATDTLKSAPPQTNDKIIVYYFHTNMRCPTCYKLESYAKSVVEADFSDAVKSGKLEWKTVNVEDNGNEHFTNDYKLYTKSIIISNVKGGKESSWKNLDKIWTLVGDQTQYMDYIRKEVKACLEGKCL